MHDCDNNIQSSEQVLRTNVSFLHAEITQKQDSRKLYHTRSNLEGRLCGKLQINNYIKANVLQQKN